MCPFLLVNSVFTPLFHVSSHVTQYRAHMSHAKKYFEVSVSITVLLVSPHLKLWRTTKKAGYFLLVCLRVPLDIGSAMKHC